MALIASINKQKRIVNYNSYHHFFGTTGKGDKSYGEMSYRLGVPLVSCFTYSPRCRIVDDMFEIDGAMVDKDLNIVKKSSSFNVGVFNEIVEHVESVSEVWRKNFDKSFEFNCDGFFDVIKNIQQPEVIDDLKLDDSWSDKIKSMKRFPLKSFGKMSMQKEKTKTFCEYSKEINGTRQPSTIVHVPMLNVERGEPGLVDVENFEIPEAKLANMIMDAEDDIHKDFDELEADAYFNNGRTRSKHYPDVINYKDFSADETRLLANRGVLGKKNEYLKDNNDDALCWEADLSSLEDYINVDFEVTEQIIDDKDMTLLEESLDDTTEFISNHVMELTSLCVYDPLRFLDAVLCEVMYNAQRNPSSDAEFIVRRVKGYKAYVMIKNTRLGSVHNPSPSFYSVVFQGEQYGNKGLFEKAYKLSDTWKCTRFVSTDRSRSSHTMNLWEQFMAICWENMECLSTLIEKFDIDHLMSISKAVKLDLIYLLSDSGEFSSTISDLRFYYFPLLNGFKGCKKESEKIITKFPTIIRSPILLHALRGITEIHESIDEESLVQLSRQLTPRRLMERMIRESERDEIDYGAEDLESDTLPTIPTPFGFNITNTRSFLKASYKQIYHNKDESNKGSDSKQIVSKIFKTEKRMRDNLKRNIKVCIEDETLNEGTDIYQCNMNAIIHATDLLKEKLIDVNGGTIKKQLKQNVKLFDTWMEKTIIMPSIIKTTYSELATTRSSFVNKGECIITKIDPKSGDFDLDVGETVKCIEAIHNLLQDDSIKGIGPAHDLQFIIEKFENDDGDRIIVKIFKKNQSTGVRDIYILTIMGRMMIRVCEDISRAICRKLPFEKLTSPSTKDQFMADHYQKAKEYCRQNNIINSEMTSHTFKESGDMTEWANRWFMKSISCPLMRLIPKSFHPLVMKVLNTVTNKHIELPRQFIISALNNPETHLYNEMSNLIKNELLGKSSENQFIEKYGTRVSCLANMMQGILHYTSSLAHSASMCLFEKVMGEYMRKKENVHVVFSFECSSDDKGILMTVIAKKGKMPNLTKIKEVWRMISRKVDSAFGLKTSLEKTNLTITSLFEFNSIFYCGNSISVPLAKFTTRCLDDSVQASLHQRVSGFYSSLRQVRENGGSGILCSLLSYAQRSSIMNNLGWRNMSWFNNDVIRMMTKYRFSYLGFRHVCTPITAGICMSEYENMKFAKDNNYWSQLRQLSINEYSDEEFVSCDTMSFGIWENSKHREMLQRLNLESQTELTLDHLRIKITGGRTLEEMKTFIKSTIQSKSFSRSLAMVQRSDIARAGVYLLWSQTFLFNNNRSSISDVIEKLDSLKTEPGDYPSEYEKWFSLEKSSRAYSFRRSRSRLRTRRYDPLINVGVTRDEIVNVIKKDWYQFEVEEDDDFERTRSNVYDLPWIKTTPEETMKNVSPREFLLLLNGVPNKFNKIRLLARGPSHSGDTIEALMRENCCADMIMMIDSTDRTDDFSNDLKVMNTISHRLSGWCDLVYEESSNNMRKLCFDDMVRHSKLLKMSEPILAGSFEDNKISLIIHSLSRGRLDLIKLFHLQGRKDMWIKNQSVDKYGDASGHGIMLKYWRKKVLFIEKDGNSIIRVTCNDLETAMEFSELANCDYSENFPRLDIILNSVLGVRGGIVFSDGEFETLIITGSSRTSSTDLFNDGGLLNTFLSSSSREFDVDELLVDSDESYCVLFAIWNYFRNSGNKRFIASSEPRREIDMSKRVRSKSESEDLLDFDIMDMIDEMMDVEMEPETDLDTDLFGGMFEDDIPEWTIAGTETIKFRRKTGWDRNEATRELIKMFNMISKQGKMRKMFSTKAMDLYWFCRNSFDR